ncbi:hypothetical protein [Paenibacillus harenae]|uniref:hypothetical protein n=1 Tax=Paenibacillus harenae TaxID=306543 RepID=UPI00048CA530|nr:hypothetical protein [Paenibacillus harenae]
MIEKCSSLIQIFIKNGLAEGSEWHYYWHKNRIPELWDSLSLPPKSHEKRPEDLPTYNRVLAEKLSEFIERKGVWDLPLILNETVSELESLIGKYVTFAGRFEGTVQTQNYYLDPQSGWDNKHPTLFTTINVNGIDIKVIIDIDPNNVVSTTTFLKLSREPYLKVIGHVWNASTDKKEIYITPLHLCPNFK